jgi:hypothetical protein
MLSVALPVSQWISPKSGFWLEQPIGSTYWPTLDVAFREGANLKVVGETNILAGHPNRRISPRRTILEANFTPEETAEKQAALMDIHFDCITRWRACSTRGELLPGVEEEYEADTREWKKITANPRLYASYCLPLQIRAREEDDVLVAEVVRSQVMPKRTNTESAEFKPLDSWLTRVRPKEVMKGKAPAGAGGEFSVIVYCSDYGGNCRRPLPDALVLLTGQSGKPEWNPAAPDFDATGCDVAEATQENLAAAREGVRQDFGPMW